jgi:hypothetical protein
VTGISDRVPVATEGGEEGMLEGDREGFEVVSEAKVDERAAVVAYSEAPDVAAVVT